MTDKQNKAANAVALLCAGYIIGMMIICKLFQGQQIGFPIWIIYTLTVILGAVIYDKREDRREAQHKRARDLYRYQMQLIRDRELLIIENEELKRRLMEANENV
ncbi:MAG: hypothetical protein IJM87_07455 [Ruminococcus sp.]|nr:hypothetical protein [Ruminococcus sp.]